MKKLLLLAAVLMLSIAMNAQEDVTKFLGIPVDGTKSEMIKKLLKKGFERSDFDRDILTGEFNGMKVNISIQTNNNKVWRLVVMDRAIVNETNIKTKYNNLCDQFASNPNYDGIFPAEYYYIPEYEDISYEITVNNKQYEAMFCQTNRAAALKRAKEKLSVKYTWEQLENPTADIKGEIDDLTDELFEKSLENKTVWFTIGEDSYGEGYFLGIFYENRYNKADGSDL